MKIQCQTFFDITATGTTGHAKPSRMPYSDLAGTQISDTESWNKSRNQQRNWETVTQLISLRTQVVNIQAPIKAQDRWCFEFEIENNDLFDNGQDKLAILKADCSGVPMLTGLNETAKISTALTVGENIWFSLVE